MNLCVVGRPMSQLPVPVRYLSTAFTCILVRVLIVDRTVPFLPVRDEFHPKRNQARQKLATLPVTRFQDLSSDVYYELSRRYPEFNEELDVSL
jgi:hypothetical protein